MSANMFEIVEEVPAFNASFAVTDLLMKTLENAAKTVATECVKTCAKHYNFDAEEAIRMLGLENLALTRKLMAKKSAGAKKEKAAKEPKAKKEAVFPMPFCAELISMDCCRGLAYNRGLYTQCPKKHLENGAFCKACQADADSNTAGAPTCGTVDMRLACGLYEYKDLKGRSPISYAKILSKLKLTQEQAIEAAAKLNIELDADHFVIPEKPKKSASKAGRPKKTGAITADGATDLFEKMESDSDSNATGDIEGQPAKAKKVKLTDEEKAAKKAALEAERAQKKAEREAKAAAEKAEKEAKRKEEAALKKAEKEAKAAEEKAEREAKRNAEKAEREAKKLAEKQAKEAEKEAKKAAKEAAKKPAAKPAVVATPAPTPAPAPEAPQKVKVVAISIDGVSYLKSSTNILYNPATREEVGIYDPATKTVLPLPEDDEEEEDGYESE